ncbi:MAG: ferrous iron transport protein B [Bacteroidota bacterium]|nr:ferrous iron transport protein B [Bacteroidota bacterium]
MKLSELKNGQKAYISKINGTGAFRQRIIEMGFIEGKAIEAIKRAPLNDPAEFNIMGYNVSIRKNDAALIEVMEEQPRHFFSGEMHTTINHAQADESITNTERKGINIALVGNPNCGKTTIFNFASNSRERVANYTGVTVSAKEASFTIDNQEINIVDLPGTYSLSSYTPEEIYVIDYLSSQKPDVVVNVIDSSNMERNLYLSTQLIDMGLKVVVALNMFDELTTNGDKLDHKALGKMLGIPVIPTIGTKGKGIADLMNTIVSVHNGDTNSGRRIQLSYGTDIDKAIDDVQAHLDTAKCESLFPGISQRFVALKLIENDKFIKQAIEKDSNNKEVLNLAHDKKLHLEKLYKKDAATLMADFRYGFVAGALRETYKAGTRKRLELTQKADSLLTHKILGLPVFFALIWLTFYSTFKVGEYPVSWIEALLGYITSGVEKLLPTGIVHDLVVDGIIGGVGGVIVFLPSIMILFFFISMMEDTGYMARTAFLMDKAMHKFGLHGKSFIPLLMGFGCNVPAVMATRTIESKRDRLLTMLVIPFMSCSARLPVYVLFISAFFPVYKSGILFGIYLIGILAAFLTAVIFSKTVFKKAESPFVMELPPYRMPTFRAIFKHTWFKSAFFLKKMGTIILLASIVVWMLGYFPRNQKISDDYNHRIELSAKEYDAKINKATDARVKESLVSEKKSILAGLEVQKEGANLEQSYISRVGKTIEPAFAPLGFDWRMTVSILTGVMAKEIVVSSMGVIYKADNKADETSHSLIAKLREQKQKTGTPLYVYFGFLVFVLLYFPCIGTLTAIHKETGSVSRVLFNTFYTTGVAWIVAFAIFQIGNLLG